MTEINAVNYKIKYFRGAWWFRIFYHNVKGGFFLNENEAKACDSKYKFSILGDINDHQDEWKIDNSFEFLLIYPMLKGFNRWKQSKFPLSEDSAVLVNKVTGFVNVSCSWTINQWGGLAKLTKAVSDGNSKSIIPTLIEGTIGSNNWYYTIGYYGNHVNYKDVIPSYGEKTTEVELWIRIKGNQFCTKCFKKRETSILVYVFLFLVAS